MALALHASAGRVLMIMMMIIACLVAAFAEWVGQEVVDRSSRQDHRHKKKTKSKCISCCSM